MSHGLPEAFTERMKEMLGEEYAAFAESFQAPRVQGLRLNGLKGDPEELRKICEGVFHLKQVIWAPEGFYYEAWERPGKHPFHEAGVYYIQEPSAMAAAAALDPKPGDCVLDLCAAPGGKSTQIAGRLQGQGFLVSNEIHPARAKILSQNLERMGAANILVTNQDSGQLARRFPEFFDKIVVDAPCSGEGMFRKDEAARDEWSPEHVALCHQRQMEILDNAARMVKPGGRIVYSTCTFAPEENEGSIQAFLESHPDFFAEAVEVPGFEGFDHGRPEWIPGSAGRVALKDTVRIWPHRVAGEGHYLASLRKQGECSSEERKGWGTGAGSGLGKEPAKAFRQFCQETVRMEDGSDKLPWERISGRYLMFGDQLYYGPQAMPDLKGMKVLRPGLHLGTFKKNRFEPSHALALYLKPQQVLRTVNISEDSPEIIRYLKGETLTVGHGADGITGGSDKGWILMTVHGFSLGWAKLAGGILKNHYPKGLRWM